MHNDLLYQIALSQVPFIGDVHAKTLIQRFGNAEAIFKAPRRQLELVEGIGSVRANSIKAFKQFDVCETEISFIEKFHISPLFLTDPQYPQRLLHCYDAPPLLYYRGNADLNTTKIISIVGTRSNTTYGKGICEQIIESLQTIPVLVVSGLAFGIDTIAHLAAMRHQLPTVAVLAHGLDRIYPGENKTLARQMTEEGGLLTDFKSGTNPDKQNFPRRNRITAGICDALLVIESGKKGGALITAEIANSYNKDVFAIPGRIGDAKSEGCLYLIQSNKASMVTSAAALIDSMNWNPISNKTAQKQRSLFVDLTEAEHQLVQLLQENESLQIDQLYFQSGLSSSTAATALLNLEMNGIITALPGKIFKLI